MRRHVAMVIMVCTLGGCSEKSSSTSTEILMAPVEVGTKTPDYEVVSPNELKLSPGVKLQVEGTGGQNNGFVLLRNGGLGGFMACGCVGATTSSCKTENDNPEHASCSGGCTDSEGNGHPCQFEGPIIGPPKDPYIFRFVDKSFLKYSQAPSAK
jgi:hypothetical protein